jgi:hypothetical protein
MTQFDVGGIGALIGPAGRDDQRVDFEVVFDALSEGTGALGAESLGSVADAGAEVVQEVLIDGSEDVLLPVGIHDDYGHCALYG